MDSSIASIGNVWAAHDVSIPSSSMDLPDPRLAYDAEAHAITRPVFAQLLVWWLRLGIRSFAGASVDFGLVKHIGATHNVGLHRADLDRIQIVVFGAFRNT